MKITIIGVGSVGDDRVSSLCEEYRTRLGHHLTVDEVEVKKGRANDPASVMEQEADRLEETVSERAMTIAMTEEGKTQSSRQTAQALNRWMVGGRKEVAFLIGGAYGLAPRLRRDADRRWSLSEMTFPHDIARMLLWEQMYRAMTIIRGEPYHK